MLAYVIRHGWSNPYRVSIYRNIAIVLALLEILVISVADTMKNVLKRGYYKEFVKTIRQVFLVEMLGVFYMFSMQLSEAYSRAMFFML